VPLGRLLLDVDGTAGLPDASYIFIPKLQKIMRALEWYILLPFGIFYGNSEYFTAIRNILRQFGIFYGNSEYFTAIRNSLRPFGIFYVHLVNFMAIWYTLSPFWYISPVLICCTTTNLATLVKSICVD
jgi:hypothetical protein